MWAKPPPLPPRNDQQKMLSDSTPVVCQKWENGHYCEVNYCIHKHFIPECINQLTNTQVVINNIGNLNLWLAQDEEIIYQCEGAIGDKLILFIITSKNKLLEVDLRQFCLLETSNTY